MTTTIMVMTTMVMTTVITVTITMTATTTAVTTGATEPVATTSRRVRSLLGGAALVASLVAVAACSDDGSSADSSGVASSTVAASTTASGDITTTVAPNPGVVLQDALAALTAGYHFTSTVTVNGAQSLVADGDRIGDASRLTITSADATVAYIITAEGSYVRPGDGDWERLDVPPATSDPISALSAPSGIAPLPTADGSVQVRVTVAATALGIAADGMVDVDVTVVNGAVTQVSYTTAIEGGDATVVTVIGPIADPTPISAPI